MRAEFVLQFAQIDLDAASTGDIDHVEDQQHRPPGALEFGDEAQRHAQVAELAPGDAIYIPPMWWHHVRADGALNILVNYWFGQPEDRFPFAALMLARKPFKKQAAIAKMVSSEAAMDNARDATQIFGGNGFMDEFVVARHDRDSKILEIGEGTTEVQLMVIARELGL